MKQYFVILFLFFCSFLSLAQSDTCRYSISGKVLDVDTKQPIPYVSIHVKGTDHGTLSNLQGEFLIDDLCTDNNTLVISCFGYCDSVCEQHHQHGKMPHVFLTQKVQELKSITIETKKNEKEGTESISQVTLDKEQIKNSPTQSLASIISEEQGVTFASAGTNVQLPIIHGLYGNRILILNNGLKHGFQNWGQDHAPEIDVSTANNITIIKGAAGVQFGPEAIGGAILVNSNPLYLVEPFYVDFGTSFQVNGKGLNTQFEIGKSSKKWAYFLNGNYTKIGDRNTPDYILTNSGKEEKSIGFGTRYRSKKWDFKFHYNILDQNLALLRSSVVHSGNAISAAFNSKEPLFIKPFSYKIGAPNQPVQHHIGKLVIDWSYSDEGKISLTAGRQLNKRKEFDVRRNSDLPIIDLELITYDYQIEWKHPDWLKLNGVMGIQYFYQDNDNQPGTGTTPYIPNYNTNRVSAFIIESRRFGKNTIDAGVRLDYESNNVRGRETSQAIFRDNYNFTNLTSSIGILKRISDNSSFRSNIGTAWRTPNMAELFSFGQHDFKNSFGLLRYYYNDDNKIKTNKVTKISDSSVKPERGFKFTNEFKIRFNKSFHKLTFYANYIENYIFDKPQGLTGTIRGPMPVFIYDQTDAFFTGVDYTWKRNWLKQLSGTLGLSYLWTSNMSGKGSLINQPPISIDYKFEWRQNKLWKLKSSKITVQSKYQFRQFQAPITIVPEKIIDGSVLVTNETEIFDFKAAPDGYFLLNLSWRFEWKRFNCGIAVNNILNTRYRDYLNQMRYFADDMGRNILFNLNYKFKSKTK